MLIQISDLPVANTSVFPEMDLPPTLEYLRDKIEIRYIEFAGTNPKVYIDEEGNIARESDRSENTESIESLTSSFLGGIQSSCQLPAVEISDRLEFDFDLIYGFGRQESLKRLTTKYYFYVLPKLTNFERETLQIYENRALPRTKSKEDEVAAYVSRSIHNGDCVNNEDAMRALIKLVEPHKPPASVQKILNKAMLDAGVVKTFRKMGEAQYFQWLTNHGRRELSVMSKNNSDSGYDIVKNQYTWLVGEKYISRMLWKALQRWDSEGATSRFILHHDKPGVNTSFAQKRKTTKDALLEQLGIISRQVKDIKDWTDIIEVLGFVPQDRLAEKQRTLSPKDLISF